jgi:hypothetical protein
MPACGALVVACGATCVVRRDHIEPREFVCGVAVSSLSCQGMN